MSTAKALVVVLEDQADPALQKLAQTRGLSVLQSPGVEQALSDILCLRPQIVILQISGPLHETCQLIGLLAVAARQIKLVAVATSHSEDAERTVRGAGAAWYLPDVAAEAIQGFLESLGASSG